MANKHSQYRGDETPVTGGVPLPAHLVASLGQDENKPSDDLGLQAYWLIKLHPDHIDREDRACDLSSLDDDKKRALIARMQRAIGISPLKRDPA